MIAGLVFATLTGLAWVVSGAIVGLAERRGCGAFRQQLVGTSYTMVAVSLALVVGHALVPNSPAFAFTCEPRALACMFAWGFLNFWMIFFMGRAMKRGPNGLAWTVTQSGLVFPFAMGVIAGRTEPTALRALGFILILSNVVVSGLSKGGKGGGGPAWRWFAPALAAFFFCGANQCAVNLVSYLPESVRPHALERMFWGGAGTFCAWAVHAAISRLLCGPAPRDPGLRAKYVYLLKICGLALIPGFLSAFWFHFNALDLLEAAGAIAIASPVEVNACLLGFFLYGFFVLKERPSRARIAAFAAGLTGVALLSLG